MAKKPTIKAKKTVTKTVTKAVKKPAKKVRRTTKRTAKDKARLSKKIFALYSEGKHTIEGCCNEIGISVRTLTNWAAENAEISDLYKKAKNEHTRAAKDGLREKLINSLERLACGYTYVETKEYLDAKGKVKNIQRLTRHQAANPTALIFALKNIDPDNFADDYKFNFEGKAQVFEIGGQKIEF